MDIEKSKAKKSIQLQRANLQKGMLKFNNPNGMESSLKIGAFLLSIPEDMDLSPGIKLCQNFYKPRTTVTNRYCGHNELQHPKSKLGYEDRPNQVEQLQIENFLWKEYFPDEVQLLLERMKKITFDVLKCLFQVCGVDEADWSITTGGNNTETGLCYTTVNHYRSDVCNKIGIVEHTDSGFITVIHADQPGFEIYDNEQWCPVDMAPGYFVVNLGDAFEILTSQLSSPGKSVLHRVIETKPNTEDRSSFTMYMGPKFDMDLYQYSKNRTLEKFQSFREFSIIKSKKMEYEFHSRV